MANNLKRFINGGNYYYFGDPPTHASGVTLNTNSLILTEAGQTEQLVATVTPSDAIDKTVTWTSSDTSVAIVARDGTVTCVEPGTCTITCTTNDGGLTATCSVITQIEYILLSDGGDINRYSELQKIHVNPRTGSDCIENGGTNWVGYEARSGYTGNLDIFYKLFTEKIVGFEVVLNSTYRYQYHPYIEFCLGYDNQASADPNNSGKALIYNGIRFIQRYDGGLSIEERINGVGTTKYSNDKGANDYYGTWTGVLENGVWHFTIAIDGGSTYTYDYTVSSSLQNLYLIGFSGNTGDSGQFGNIKSVKTILLE